VVSVIAMVGKKESKEERKADELLVLRALFSLLLRTCAKRDAHVSALTFNVSPSARLYTTLGWTHGSSMMIVA
jgi:hypothetical protein